MKTKKPTMKNKDEIKAFLNDVLCDLNENANKHELTNALTNMLFQLSKANGSTDTLQCLSELKNTKINWQRKTIEQLQADKKELVNGLIEGKLQIDNLQTKFTPTNSGNGVSSRLSILISKHL